MARSEGSAKRFIILVADDDEDDRTLIGAAMEQGWAAASTRFVRDGQELMDYLRHHNEYANLDNSPRPNLILLDLNMPKKDGHEALQEIKSDPSLKAIPIVVFTTSQEDEDIARCYTAGANSFMTKPLTYDDLVLAIEAIEKYWLATVKLPKPSKD